MNYEPIQQLVDPLKNRTPLAMLAPQRIWDEALDQRIASLSIEELAPTKDGQPYAKLLKSGLHLWNESLDRSHSLSQAVDNRTGSYWHGIMHRMEADYSNAKYWFYQVGSHPAFTAVFEHVVADLTEHRGSTLSSSEFIQSIVNKGTWDPYWMIDLVESALAAKDRELISMLERIQHIEMAVLLDYTYRQYRERSIH